MPKNNVELMVTAGADEVTAREVVPPVLEGSGGSELEMWPSSSLE